MKIKDKKFYFVFFWLSFVCVITYIFQEFVYGFTDLFILNKSAIYNMEIWRFFSAIFLHGSIVHLLLNLFALLLFGFILEKRIGSKNFLILFITSGVFANFISVNFYFSSLGASGAIFGILGALMLLDPFMMVFVFNIIVPMFVAGLLWVIGNILEALGAFGETNTGNIAHLSGIIIGVIFGLIFWRYRNIREKNNKINIPENIIQSWEERYMK